MTVSQNTANTISVGPLLVPFPDGTYGLIYCPYIPLEYVPLGPSRYADQMLKATLSGPVEFV